MYILLWQFRPKPGLEKEFESAYGPEGDWAKFFRHGKGYCGTTLLKESRSAFYITIDEWSSREAYETFRSQHENRYRGLDKQFEALTIAESNLGSFLLLS